MDQATDHPDRVVGQAADHADQVPGLLPAPGASSGESDTDGALVAACRTSLKDGQAALRVQAHGEVREDVPPLGA